MSALGARFDLIGEYSLGRGVPWSLAFVYKAGGVPVDLSGGSARLVILDALESGNSLWFTGPPQVRLGGATGWVDLALAEADTASVTWSRARYRFYYTPAGGPETLLLYGRLGVVEEGD